jgi:hypothetical protein
MMRGQGPFSSGPWGHADCERRIPATRVVRPIRTLGITLDITRNDAVGRGGWESALNGRIARHSGRRRGTAS